MAFLPGQVWIIVRAHFDKAGEERYEGRLINSTHIASIVESSSGATEITMANGDKITTPDTLDYIHDLLQNTDETIARIEVLCEGKAFGVEPPPLQVG